MVLESQYQSSLTKACQQINESRDDVCVECVGYLLEELRDEKNVEAFKKDVETSNIFIGSLIFVQVTRGGAFFYRRLLVLSILLYYCCGSEALGAECERASCPCC